MKVTCIGSGSDGNCWYCETDKGTGFFLDAGCPPKAIIDLGIDIANKPFFVTHEHGDHAKYAMGLHEQYGTTIIATPRTLQAIGLLPVSYTHLQSPHLYPADLYMFPMPHLPG